jgi:predicted Ser/Thr protein kinase/HAMP domain-containing protein
MPTGTDTRPPGGNTMRGKTTSPWLTPSITGGTESPLGSQTIGRSPTISGADPLARLIGAEPIEKRGLGLSGRIFLGASALLAATLGVALAVTSWQAGRAAEARIRADLQTMPGIFAGYIDAQTAARRGQVESLAAQPGSKALLAEASLDAATLHDSAVELAKSLDARIAFLFDFQGGLLSRSDQPDGQDAGRSFAEIPWVRSPIEEQASASAFIVDVRTTPGLYLVTAAPVVQGAGAEARVNGAIAAAHELDDTRARELARVAGADVAFLANFGARDAAPKVQPVAATERLSSGSGDWLTAVRRANPEIEARLFTDGKPYGPFEFLAPGDAGDRFIGQLLPIVSARGEPIAAVLLARSKTAELAAFHALRRSLLIAGLLVLLASMPLSLLVAQRISKPIRQLAEGAEQIGRGQLDVTLPPAQGGGEVGALTRAFEGMVAELRAKAQLEAALAQYQSTGDTGSEISFTPDQGEELRPGLLFANRYEILAQVGEGGMGAVFRANDRELDDEVALKCLRVNSNHPEAASLLKEEIKLARMITHVNVVRVYDVGESAGRRFFTMEYVRGQTLRELLDRGGALDLTPALQIAKQVCRGLSAVHKAGIVHGDLKPQNVMVLPNGVAKLMDFGVARVRSQTAEAPIQGTPLYMSPEQARGAELDDRSDIYAAGVLMFELFTGRPPFQSDNVTEILRMHQHDRPPNPQLMREDLPEVLSRIILACLDKSRLQRPSTASDLDRLLMRVRV